MAEIGVSVRIGMHTGECEIAGDKLRGVALSIGARVMATAEAGEILVSQTVRDLLAGSGVKFADRGLYELKGIPDKWRLYAAT
jgi:class 3 adenylate cyclase